MTFESFSQGDSPLHRADARIKLIATALLTLIIALCQGFATAAGGLGLGVILLLAARLPLGLIGRRLLLVNGFIGFLWLTLPLTYPGETLFTLGPLTVSRAGVLLAGLITLKTNAIIMIFISLLATSSVADLGHAMARLHLPDKLCLLLLFSYRYIFVINQEYQRLVRAAKLRGFKPGTNLHTYRTFAHLFGMTLVKSWNRAERVRQAMMLRGFKGRFYTLDERRAESRDFLLLGLLSLAATALLATEFLKRTGW
jgi:cobalt/nickel transport system permease protein